MQLEQYLYQFFHFNTFRPGQKEVITSILEGHHTMALLPTGTGKSLCYQLSGYLLEGQVLIVSPLLSLMQDQVEHMKMNGEKQVVAINSFLTGVERKQVLNSLGKYKFIYISPETLLNDGMLERLKKLTIKLFVIDEAHCISQWGYDFRPDYLKLGSVRHSLGQPLTLALTATATKEVIHDIIDTLGLDQCQKHLFSVDRPNIALSVEKTDHLQQKWKRLYDYVSQFQGPGIVYFSSKKMVEQAVDYLQNKGISRVMAYHAGLDQESRILIQQQFLHNQLDIICATSAFGMGINKDNIRFVIHFHMPQQMESYLQEIGRAGRDGKQSMAVLLYSPGDEQLAFQLAQSEIPSSVQLDWLSKVIQHGKQDGSDLQNEGFQEELKRVGGFTDVQWRVISQHLSLGEEEERDPFFVHLKNELENRRILKRNKVASMMSWIQTTTCRRDQILLYFGEEIRKIKPEYCCDCCGFDREVLKKSTNKNEVLAEFSWKQRLADILLNK